MHYKNGREANEGDPVIYLDSYKKKVVIGRIWSLSAGTTCNCQVAQIIPGGVTHTCQSLNEMYHAEDALLAIEPLALAPQAAKPVVTEAVEAPKDEQA